MVMKENMDALRKILGIGPEAVEANRKKQEELVRAREAGRVNREAQARNAEDKARRAEEDFRRKELEKKELLEETERNRKERDLKEAKEREREAAEAKERREKEARMRAEEVDGFFRERRAAQGTVIHETPHILASPDRGIPEYYFMVSKNPKDDRYYVGLIRVLGAHEDVVGVPSMSPVFQTENFNDEAEAKRRAEELAQSGVEWQKNA